MRDPRGEAAAVALCERAFELSQAAQSRALARRDAEADAYVLSILARALRDMAQVKGIIEPARRQKPANDMKANDIKVRQRAVERQVAALSHASTAAKAAKRASLPPPAGKKPLPGNAALGEQDRRIDAVAARFYAKRGAG